MPSSSVKSKKKDNVKSRVLPVPHVPQHGRIAAGTASRKKNPLTKSHSHSYLYPHRHPSLISRPRPNSILVTTSNYRQRSTTLTLGPSSADLAVRPSLSHGVGVSSAGRKSKSRQQKLQRRGDTLKRILEKRNKLLGSECLTKTSLLKLKPLRRHHRPKDNGGAVIQLDYKIGAAAAAKTKRSILSMHTIGDRTHSAVSRYFDADKSSHRNSSRERIDIASDKSRSGGDVCAVDSDLLGALSNFPEAQEVEQVASIEAAKIQKEISTIVYNPTLATGGPATYKGKIPIPSMQTIIILIFVLLALAGVLGTIVYVVIDDDAPAGTGSTIQGRLTNPTSGAPRVKEDTTKRRLKRNPIGIG